MLFLYHLRRLNTVNSIKVIEHFANNDDACTDYLCKLRWDKEPACPYCGSIKTGIKAKENGRRRRLACYDCGNSFSPTVNTIMHKTKIPLWKWFLAISLLAEAKKSISSRQLSRHLGISVPSAYRLSQRIRKGLLGMRSPILQGIVEIDETYIGGKPRHQGPENIRKRGRGTDKAMVVGMVERKGRVIAKPVAKGQYRQGFVRNMILENVKLGDSEIHTDEYPIYNRIGALAPHKRVNHSAKEYVKNKTVHTNSVEGYWSLVKRAWYGTHHNYTVKYLPLYIAESVFKYNAREEKPEVVFDAMLGAVAGRV